MEESIIGVILNTQQEVENRSSMGPGNVRHAVPVSKAYDLVFTDSRIAVRLRAGQQNVSFAEAIAGLSERIKEAQEGKLDYKKTQPFQIVDYEEKTLADDEQSVTKSFQYEKIKSVYVGTGVLPGNAPHIIFEMGLLSSQRFWLPIDQRNASPVSARIQDVVDQVKDLIKKSPLGPKLKP